jgi:tRNA threonylcarbamoyladenosine biosynthesis protein TsaB
MVRDILNQGGISLSELDALAFGRGPGSFTGVRIGIGIAQGLALGAGAADGGRLDAGDNGAGRISQTGATRVLAAIDARMGEVYWAEYVRDEQGVWHGEESEAVLKPEAVCERMMQLDGEWVTVGTGWQAWPELVAGAGHLTLAGWRGDTARGGRYAAAGAYLLARAKPSPVEKAEPVYLRNEVAWKKLPGRE